MAVEYYIRERMSFSHII